VLDRRCGGQYVCRGTGATMAVIVFGLNLSPVSAADSIPQLVARTKPATIQIVAFDENWSPVLVSLFLRMD
jgi:hypothetical protein